MQLKNYFENNHGTGVMSTAGRDGNVATAIYASPQILDDGTLAFIMRDRLTHKNINENPYAAFMFIEDSAGYKGVRLYLKKVKEDDNAELIAKMTRQSLSPEEDAAMGPKFIVYFQVEKALKLVGGDDVVLD
ncbi:MAG: pyridoxamine 5'-phosphate oxidase [Desulfuromonas sp.]|nr:MAG: pyridoxamine 5'-phosphate oxidase [Desulfuromonas sp.]